MLQNNQKNNQNQQQIHKIAQANGFSQKLL